MNAAHTDDFSHVSMPPWAPAGSPPAHCAPCQQDSSVRARQDSLCPDPSSQCRAEAASAPVSTCPCTHTCKSTFKHSQIVVRDDSTASAASRLVWGAPPLQCSVTVPPTSMVGSLRSFPAGSLCATVQWGCALGTGLHSPSHSVRSTNQKG